MSRVLCAIRVKATPERAFRAFTAETAAWWRPHGLFQFTQRDAGPLALESGVGGRVTMPLANGDIFEVGRILVWEPPERLAFSWRAESFAPDQQTEVRVRFEPIGAETRVTVEHWGWDQIPAENVARHHFPLLPFQQRLAEWWQSALARVAELSTSSRPR